MNGKTQPYEGLDWQNTLSAEWNVNMRIFRKRQDSDEHKAERKQLKNVQKRLTTVENRLSFVEAQVKVIRREV